MFGPYDSFKEDGQVFYGLPLRWCLSDVFVRISLGLCFWRGEALFPSHHGPRTHHVTAGVGLDPLAAAVQVTVRTVGFKVPAEWELCEPLEKC